MLIKQDVHERGTFQLNLMERKSGRDDRHMRQKQLQLFFLSGPFSNEPRQRGTKHKAIFFFFLKPREIYAITSFALLQQARVFVECCQLYQKPAAM